MRTKISLKDIPIEVKRIDFSNLHLLGLGALSCLPRYRDMLWKKVKAKTPYMSFLDLPYPFCLYNIRIRDDALLIKTEEKGYYILPLKYNRRQAIPDLYPFKYHNFIALNDTDKIDAYLKPVFALDTLRININKLVLIDKFNTVKGLGDGRLDLLPYTEDNPFRDRPDAILRGIAYSALLHLTLDSRTIKWMSEYSDRVYNIGRQRLRAYLLFIASLNVNRVFDLFRATGLLHVLFPEIEECIGVDQNRFHHEDIADHCLSTVRGISETKPFLRLIALMHDTAKVHTRRYDEDKDDYTFYGHEQEGAKAAFQRFTRLGFTNLEARIASSLIREHMYNVTLETNTSSIKRWIERLYPASPKQALLLRIADERAIDKEVHLRPETSHLIKQVQIIEREGMECQIRDLQIDGRDLISLNIEEPMRQRVMKELVEWVRQRPSRNRRESLLDYIQQHYF